MVMGAVFTTVIRVVLDLRELERSHKSHPFVHATGPTTLGDLIKRLASDGLLGIVLPALRDPPELQT
jgi:hypothetical protein